MPSRNIVKTFAPQGCYHVYNRGVAKQPIFTDAADKRHFIKILARHLDPSDASLKADGTAYRKFNQDIDLMCYCLMGNHFHLLMRVQEDARVLSELLRAVLTAYTMYFNKRHKRVGGLFQSVYKASLISHESYLLHISRYIHLNPRTYRTYQWSSLRFYLGEPTPPWCNPQPILDLFADESYLEFLEDYEDNHAMLDELKLELAHTNTR